MLWHYTINSWATSMCTIPAYGVLVVLLGSGLYILGALLEACVGSKQGLACSLQIGFLALALEFHRPFQKR